MLWVYMLRSKQHRDEYHTKNFDKEMNFSLKIRQLIIICVKAEAKKERPA